MLQICTFFLTTGQLKSFDYIFRHMTDEALA
jgi:hypothetical protein